MLIMGFMFVLIVIASIETSKSPDGFYTSAPPALECTRLQTWWAILPNEPFSGFASREELSSTLLGQNYSSIPVARISKNNVEERYWLYNFTGYCVGQVADMAR